jgi:hypothetical protein
MPDRDNNIAIWNIVKNWITPVYKGLCAAFTACAENTKKKPPLEQRLEGFVPGTERSGCVSAALQLTVKIVEP